MLWFVQHYLWGLADAPDVDHGLHHAWNEGYVAVNQGFADAVVAELEREPEAAVFFHDYHLYLAPRSCASGSRTRLLAHFVHIPWPQPDYWRVLPESIRRAIHEGLLANDVVGFHTDALAPQLPALLRRPRSAPRPTSRPRRPARRARTRDRARGRSRSTRTSSTSSPTSERVLERGGASSSGGPST